ncbi:hypothetical protein [Macrococcus animalis]|uniref:hypothetical protein n=1 Tax=Macrococcus animalis TaxID=3395467 RepID=UPI0039BE1C1D
MKNINNILIMLISFLATILVVWYFVKGDAQEVKQDKAAQTEQATTEEGAKKQPSDVKLGKDEVLKINDKTFKKQDIAFLRNMQKAQIEVTAKKDKSGDLSFYKDKIKDQDSENLQLQNQVELEAIALLGKEKGYAIDKAKLKEDVAAFKKKYASSKYFEEAEKLMDQKDFDQLLEKYVHDQSMRKRVIEEIKKIKKADNPKLKGKELDFEVRQYFDDLYKDAVNDLTITTNYK